MGEEPLHSRSTACNVAMDAENGVDTGLSWLYDLSDAKAVSDQFILTGELQMPRIGLALLVILVPVLLYAQTDDAAEEDSWAPFRFFLGQWQGTGEGTSGASTSEAGYRLVLNQQFIEVRHRAVFEPQERNPEGEIHEDAGFISYDRTRGRYVFRQFHGEGFVNQYILDSLSADGKTLVFVSEAIENIPPGWKARLTQRIIDEDEYESIFEVAAPERAFGCLSRNRFKRQGKPD